MMRKTISRTMATSTFTAYTVKMVNGKPEAKELATITIMGKATEKDAIKAVKEKFGKNVSATIGEIKVDEATYEISVEDFVKHATKIGGATEAEAKADEANGAEAESEEAEKETTN